MKNFKNLEFTKIDEVIKCFLSLSLVIAFLFSSCESRKKNSLTIAAAANTMQALDKIVEGFSQEYNVDCQVIYGSSGKLTAQILEGAPYDVFISADMEYPGKIYKAGIATEEPVEYALGKLLLWSRYPINKPLQKILTSDRIQKIGIANPRVAPYGKAAKEVLEKMGIENDVKHKLVYGESVLQTNQFIVSGAVDASITSGSFGEQMHQMDDYYFEEIDQSLYSPIRQGFIAISRPNKSAKSTLLFSNFLKSEKAQKVLQKHGFEASSP